MIHHAPREALPGILAEGLMTAQALHAKGRPEGAANLARYLKQLKLRPEHQARYDGLAGDLPPDAPAADRAILALKAIRGDTLADSGGDWFYGFSPAQAARAPGILERNGWPFSDRVPLEVDVEGLRRAGLIMDEANMAAPAIMARRVRANRAKGVPLLTGVRHPRVMVKGGVVPPQYIKQLETTMDKQARGIGFRAGYMGKQASVKDKGVSAAAGLAMGGMPFTEAGDTKGALVGGAGGAAALGLLGYARMGVRGPQRVDGGALEELRHRSGQC